MLKAHRAVLSKDLPVLAVGGITPDAMTPWRQAGAQGFGLGSALYALRATPDEVRAAARRYVMALGKD